MNMFDKITYGELLNTAAENWGSSEAIIFKDHKYTYAEVEQKVDILAKSLIDIGVKKGDKVSLWLNNCPEWIFLFFAVAKIGSVIVPVNTRFKAKELSYVVGQSDSSVLILGSPYRQTNYYEILKDIVPEITKTNEGEINSEIFPYLKKVISVGCQYEGTINYNELIDRGKKISSEVLHQRELQVKADDLVNIFYTSGTTGFPKGVMHSHETINVNMRNVANRLQMDETDRILLFLPLFHVFASLVGMTAAFSRGSCLVLMEAFDPGISLKLIENEKVTLIYAFDTMFNDMMKHQDFKKYSKASLRSGICPVPPHIAKEVLKNFCNVANAYGMTETTGVTSLSLPDDSHEKIINTNGFPMPGFSVKVIDPSSKKELAINEKGELCVKGPSVMLGYYKKPKETEKVLDEDGWLQTGDAAYLDEEGYVHIVGRIKDIIRVGGENVDPVQVEALLSTHPAVFQASVVAAPDQRLSEVCFAFVQLNKGRNVTEQDLIDFCKNKIAPFKIPRGISFVDHFPMTSSGKIQKFELRKLAKEKVYKTKGISTHL